MLKKIYRPFLIFTTDLQIKNFISEVSGVSEIKSKFINITLQRLFDSKYKATFYHSDFGGCIVEKQVLPNGNYVHKRYLGGFSHRYWGIS